MLLNSWSAECACWGADNSFFFLKTFGNNGQFQGLRACCMPPSTRHDLVRKSVGGSSAPPRRRPKKAARCFVCKMNKHFVINKLNKYIMRGVTFLGPNPFIIQPNPSLLSFSSSFREEKVYFTYLNYTIVIVQFPSSNSKLRHFTLMKELINQTQKILWHRRYKRWIPHLPI